MGDKNGVKEVFQHLPSKGGFEYLSAIKNLCTDLAQFGKVGISVSDQLPPRHCSSKRII